MSPSELWILLAWVLFVVLLLSIVVNVAMAHDLGEQRDGCKNSLGQGPVPNPPAEITAQIQKGRKEASPNMRKWYRHVIAVRLFDKLMDNYHVTAGDVDAILKEVAKLYREARAEIGKDGL